MEDNRLQDHLDSRFDSLDGRLERVESKLDSHLERLSKAEASIEWLRGNAKVVTVIVLALAGFFATAYFEQRSVSQKEIVNENGR